jgi:hypothetical protein
MNKRDGDDEAADALRRYHERMTWNMGDLGQIMEPGTTLNKGDTIRENRSGAAVETVLSCIGNVVETYQGDRYHITKIVRCGGAGCA